MPRKAGTTKEKIISAAIDIFSEKGYVEASMRELAETVGVTPASIYNHFASKADILDVILEEYFVYITQSALQLDDIDKAIGEMDAKTVMESMFSTFPDKDAVKHTKTLKIILQEKYREPKAGAFVRDVMFKRNEEYVQAVLDKLVAAGKLPPVRTAVYAKILISLTISASVEMMFYGFKGYNKNKQVSRREMTELVFDMILRDGAEEN